MDGITNEQHLGYEREEFDFGFIEMEDIYSDLDSFQIAMENSRAQNDYFLMGKMLLFGLSPYKSYFPFSDLESKDQIYEEAIECFNKSKKDLFFAEAILMYCEYKIPENQFEKTKYSEMLLTALSLFEKKNNKGGIYAVANIMRTEEFMEQHLIDLEKKYNVEFQKINYSEILHWNYFLTKLSIIPLVITFFVLSMSNDTKLLIITIGFSGILTIVLIIFDLVQLRNEKKRMKKPYSRFFEWLAE